MKHQPIRQFHPKVRVESALKKIATQFPADNPGARLFFAVFRAAVEDAFLPRGSAPAKDDGAMIYLQGEIPHAEYLGVKSEWVRRVLREHGLPVQGESCKDQGGARQAPQQPKR